VRRHAAAGTGERGRRSKFTDDEVKVFRKRVESGKVTVSGLAIQKEHWLGWLSQVSPDGR